MRETKLASIAARVKRKQLYDMAGVADVTGLCVRWLRRLCREGKVDHHKMLGRYYMTPREVADLLVPVKKTKKAR